MGNGDQHVPLHFVSCFNVFWIVNTNIISSVHMNENKCSPVLAPARNDLYSKTKQIRDAKGTRGNKSTHDGFSLTQLNQTAISSFHVFIPDVELKLGDPHVCTIPCIILRCVRAPQNHRLFAELEVSPSLAASDKVDV